MENNRPQGPRGVRTFDLPEGKGLGGTFSI